VNRDGNVILGRFPDRDHYSAHGTAPGLQACRIQIKEIEIKEVP
jgi:hypothetical protein